MANVNFFDFAKHILSTPASGDVGAMVHLADCYRTECCTPAFKLAYDLFTFANENGKDGNGQAYVRWLQATVCGRLIQGNKRDCVDKLRALKEYIAHNIDEMVMEHKAPVYYGVDGNLTGEGATVKLCSELKDIMETMKEFVELAFRLDMALQKFGLSFWE
jgi:hypothetical protein